jgi:hypothetical protein
MSFICVDPERKRAVYFCPSVGRRRFYRSGFPVTDQRTLKLLEYQTVNAAAITAKRINDVHDEKFLVVDKDTLQPPAPPETQETKRTMSYVRKGVKKYLGV